ncbi:MAG TPA: GNAT family protein [Rubrobacteraceae bacterium]|nr:GNAT family protein [Rubrobacteraceae bacterium]
MRIETQRLTLIPTTLEHIRTELEEPGRLGALLGVRVPEGWPPGEYDRDAMEFFRSLLESDAQRYEGWLGWYVVTHDAPPMLVAGAGFLGPPEDGTVEIGYSVVAEARGAGYATEIVGALVRRAFESDLVQRVVAETNATNEASQRVLERNGFTPAGPGRDAASVRFQKVKS